MQYAEFLNGAAFPKTLELKPCPRSRLPMCYFGREIDRSRSGAMLKALGTYS